MILDQIQRMTELLQASGNLADAVAWLRGCDAARLPNGRTEIDGDRLFAIVHEYEPKPEGECVWESHRRYVDVQYVVAGVELMGVQAVERASIKTPYDTAGDAVFYHPPARTDRATRLRVHAGEAAVFFPWDVHMPGARAEGVPGPVRKIVVKAAWSAGMP